jgi:two-component system, chemotaxis family, chemotaxis protein CheY
MEEVCRVLLADDVAEIRMLLRLTLELDGRFEIVGEARNGVEAVQIACRQKPDVVILDLAMPVMDGLQAARAILQTDGDARIVMITSLGGVADKAAEALRLGAKDIISKPFEAAQIETALRRLWSPTDG